MTATALTSPNHAHLEREHEAIARLVAAVPARGVVALTGAGMSTESGIPDYRSPAALAKPRRPIQGPEFLRSATVRRRYWARSLVGWERFSAAEPNEGHRALAALEAAGVVDKVITQNVDRLHTAAGSHAPIELHGALAEVHCLACDARESRASVQSRLVARNPSFVAAATEHAATAPDGDADLPAALLETFSVVDCLACGGALKPRVVFFGENVARPLVDEAFGWVERASMLLVLGTSLTVFSGYRFLLRASERGVPVAIVNRGPVRGEERASLKLELGTSTALAALARAHAAPGYAPAS
jgi:NAD-dependent deacetylase sirtuin 4